MQASLLHGGAAVEETEEFQKAVLRERERLEQVGGSLGCHKLLAYHVVIPGALEPISSSQSRASTS